MLIRLGQGHSRLREFFHLPPQVEDDDEKQQGQQGNAGKEDALDAHPFLRFFFIGTIDQREDFAGFDRAQARLAIAGILNGTDQIIVGPRQVAALKEQLSQQGEGLIFFYARLQVHQSRLSQIIRRLVVIVRKSITFCQIKNRENIEFALAPLVFSLRQLRGFLHFSFTKELVDQDNVAPVSVRLKRKDGVSVSGRQLGRRSAGCRFGRKVFHPAVNRSFDAIIMEQVVARQMQGCSFIGRLQRRRI